MLVDLYAPELRDGFGRVRGDSDMLGAVFAEIIVSIPAQTAARKQLATKLKDRYDKLERTYEDFLKEIVQVAEQLTEIAGKAVARKRQILPSGPSKNR